MSTPRSKLIAERKRSLGAAAVVVLLLAVAPGCGEKRVKPKMWPADVRGQILLDGKPLSSGTVTFLPASAEEQGGKPGIGRIGPDGRYRIGNANTKDPAGLKPDRYVVTVLAMLLDPGQNGAPIPHPEIPEEYTDYRLTPLAAEVAPGLNHIDFNLRTSVQLGSRKVPADR